jgi:hypothetical protein
MTAPVKAEELWKPIPGFGDYDASTEGRIRSRRRNWRNWPGEGEGRIMQPQPNHAGYPQVIVRGDDGKTYCRRVHRLVLITWIGQPPGGEWQGSHMDGDPTNNAVGNLAWELPQANQRRSTPHGRPRGNYRGRCRSKLDEAIVQRLRRLENPNVRELAKKYGVTAQTIKHAIDGVTWGWVE